STRPQDQCGEVDRHPRRPDLRLALAAPRLRRGLCLVGRQGAVRKGLREGLDQGDEPRPVRSRRLILTIGKRQTKRAAVRPPFVFPICAGVYSPAASRGGCWPSAPLASRSSPVSWSTTFIDSRVLPRSSKPSSFTLTLSPSLTTSEVFCTRAEASWVMSTRPSLEPKEFTKAPNSITLTTVPS